jgi:hypothetical protein
MAFMRCQISSPVSRVAGDDLVLACLHHVGDGVAQCHRKTISVSLTTRVALDKPTTSGLSGEVVLVVR